jgi:hypothetical protein
MVLKIERTINNITSIEELQISYRFGGDDVTTNVGGFSSATYEGAPLRQYTEPF